MVEVKEEETYCEDCNIILIGSETVLCTDCLQEDDKFYEGITIKHSKEHEG